jgi:hypothetical protein
MSRRI